MYARHTEGPPTDEYLLYDLTKSPSQNRPDGYVKNFMDVGKVIFPPGQKNVPGDNVWVPEDQQHIGGSRFYWAPDSRAILFEDQVGNRPRNLVLVTLNDQGEPAAFEHPVTLSDVCGREIPGVELNWRMDRVQIGPNRDGSRSIVVNIRSFGQSCPARALQLYKSDFRPAKPEVHVIEEPTRGMIREGHPPVPPKKK